MRKAAVKRNREVIFQTHLWMGKNVIGLFSKKGEAGWLLGLADLLEGIGTVSPGRPWRFYHWKLLRGV